MTTRFNFPKTDEEQEAFKQNPIAFMEGLIKQNLPFERLLCGVFRMHQEMDEDFTIETAGKDFYVTLAFTALHALETTQKGFETFAKNLDRPIIYTADDAPNMLNKVLP